MADTIETVETEPSSPRRQPRSRIDPYRELVGILTDSEVAAKAGVTPSAVTQYRSRNGIAPALPQGATRRAQLRGKRNKAAKRRQAAAPEPKLDHASRADRLVAPHAHLLGVASDLYVAELAGVTVPDVRAFRDRQSLADPLPPEPDEGPLEASESSTETTPLAIRPRTSGAPRRSRIDAHRELLGVLSDGEVAARAGVTANAVQMFRKKHGIPAATPGRKWRGPAKPTEIGEATPPGALRVGSSGATEGLVGMSIQPPVTGASVTPVFATPRNGRKVFAWRLSFASDAGTVTRIAVAADATSACSLASGVGDVVGLERLSEALV